MLSEVLPMKTGSVFIMQPTVHHFGWAPEETIVQVHGVGPWGQALPWAEDFATA